MWLLALLNSMLAVTSRMRANCLQTQHLWAQYLKFVMAFSSFWCSFSIATSLRGLSIFLDVLDEVFKLSATIVPHSCLVVSREEVKSGESTNFRFWNFVGSGIHLGDDNSV